MQKHLKMDFNIEILPEEARKLFIEFYEFLLNKYANVNEKNNRENIEKAILADQVQIDTKKWKFNRKEIYGR